MAAMLHLRVRPGEQSASWHQASPAASARHSREGRTLAPARGSPRCFGAILQASLGSVSVSPHSTAPWLTPKLHSGTPWQAEVLAVAFLVLPSHQVSQNSTCWTSEPVTWTGSCSLHSKPRHDCICGFSILGIWFFRPALHTPLPADHGWLSFPVSSSLSVSGRLAGMSLAPACPFLKHT